jgi:hypothetical protein
MKTETVSETMYYNRKDDWWQISTTAERVDIEEVVADKNNHRTHGRRYSGGRLE